MKSDASESRAAMPNLLGKMLEPARATLRDMGQDNVLVRSATNGANILDGEHPSWVVAFTIPESGTALSGAKTAVELLIKNPHAPPVLTSLAASDPMQMPDLIDKTLLVADQTLDDMGLDNRSYYDQDGQRIPLKGNEGRKVSSTTPVAGTDVTPVTPISVTVDD